MPNTLFAADTSSYTCLNSLVHPAVTAVYYPEVAEEVNHLKLLAVVACVRVRVIGLAIN